MRKIHILGGPGSGKTTLAAALAARFQIPHYDLDLIGHKNGMRDEAYVEDTLAIAGQPGWVTENIGLVWIDRLLQGADSIVLLEVSWPVAAYRIIRRHITKSLQGTNLYPGIKPLFLFLQWTRDYRDRPRKPRSFYAGDEWAFLIWGRMGGGSIPERCTQFSLCR